MNLRKIAMGAVSLFAAVTSLVFISQAQPSEAAGPVVTTSWSVYAPSQPTRLQIPGDECGDLDGQGNCVGYDTKSDPVGPALKTVGITFKNRVSGLPSGWRLCGSEDVMRSIDVYSKNGLVQIPSMNWSKYGVYVGSGEGMSLQGDAFEESAGIIYQIGNSSRISYQGWAVICGPDSKTPSGTVWKLLLGSTITLRPINTF